MREEGWGRGHHLVALQKTRARWWPGGLDLLLGSSLLRHSRNPLTRDSEAMPASLILHPFARTSLPPVPRTRVPARGELVTVIMLLLSSEESNRWVLSESHPGWSSGCSGFSSGSVSPTRRGNAEESVGHGTFASKLPKLRKEL